MTPAREELERSLRSIAGPLDEMLTEWHGQKVGFALFVFGFGETGNIAYISNAQRADMVNAVREWLTKMDAGLTTDPRGPRAKT